MGSQLYWVGGGKGGAGKSMVSMALLDYLVARGVSTMLIESDTSNPDVCKTYKDALPCELLDLDKIDGWIQLVNACDANRDRVVVVNTAARSNAGVASFGGTLITSLGDLDRSRPRSTPCHSETAPSCGAGGGSLQRRWRPSLMG